MIRHLYLAAVIAAVPLAVALVPALHLINRALTRKGGIR